jgi:hypothetical protein
MDGDKAELFVPVTGVIFLHTALGIFLDVGERRIFVPQAFTPWSPRRYAFGEAVTLQIVPSFAKEARLID